MTPITIMAKPIAKAATRDLCLKRHDWPGVAVRLVAAYEAAARP